MDVWGTTKDVLRSVAPVLGTAVGGPFGGMAARAITGALLGEESDDEGDAAAANGVNGGAVCSAGPRASVAAYRFLERSWPRDRWPTQP